ncbi:serine--tRNA synthetase-like protein Slimp [Thrips palmi]|uniref:Serine--tRNA synthetase-like protein Slimp n=1 Tax=Thrips palmi TaxID=161013 RepID=A0A6P8ZYQ9_THRPL|nr:serine--tRNA synthetase-like protein Slimp [Thrips palmi]
MFSKTAKLLPITRRVNYTIIEKCQRGCTSSLFITGDKARESCAILTPHVNLDVRFENLELLIENVKLRGMNIDIHQVKTSWHQYVALKDYISQLDKEKTEAVAKMKSAYSNNPKLFKTYETEKDKVREKMSAASQELWNLERTAVIGGLSLPNVLNLETPVDGVEKIVHSFGSKPVSSSDHPSHLEVAEKLGLLEYYDSSYYFLKDKAAQFEMGISYLFMDKFCDTGFVHMSNSDFGRSITVEGVGLDPRDAESVFILEKDSNAKDPLSRLHLVGGASLVSFCGYHAKTITHVKHLPLRYITMGRHYNPESSNGLPGLFSTWQSSAVEAFIASGDSIGAQEEFQLCLKKLISLYENLGYHFRVEYLPPMKLRPWESLRASVQMFSMSLQQYIEIGSLSLCDDFISQRLLMCCETNSEKPLGFTHVVSGTFVSVPRLLGCVLEYDGEKFSLPPKVMAAM